MEPNNTCIFSFHISSEGLNINLIFNEEKISLFIMKLYSLFYVILILFLFDVCFLFFMCCFENLSKQWLFHFNSIQNIENTF